MAAGEFKAKCLAVLDEVKQTGEPVIITKRGQPVARLVAPVESASPITTVDSLFGSLRGLITVTGDLDDLIEPIFREDEWDHLKGDWDPTKSE